MTSILLAIALFAPASGPTSTPAPEAAAAPNMMGDEAMVHRGAPFTEAAQVSLDEVAKAPETFSGKTVKVAGTVKQVCVKKGCWLTLAGESPAARARVTFKDYGFFAPLDSGDHAALVEGQVEVKALSEAERKHLAEDAGQGIETIPSHELRLVATALELRKKAD